MSFKTYPPLISKIKSIQRGTAVSAGTISITSINPNKSFVTCFSASSAGTVATNSDETGTLLPVGGSVAASSNGSMGGGSYPQFSGTRSFSGGQSAFTSAEYGITITNSTTLTATGMCKWEVIEYV